MLFFVDESGTDGKDSPYEVLAGVAIQEQAIWPLTQKIRSFEREYFGMSLRDASIEFKGKKLLKSKVFRFAAQSDPLPEQERSGYAQQFIQKSLNGLTPSRQEFTAYGQTVLAFVEAILDECETHHVKTFASIVNPASVKPVEGDYLRKDYAYLFERFYYYLEDTSDSEMGIVVFDELEKSRCKRLLTQMEAYFLKTHKGRLRSSRIIPEPFFVHSDLTTMVQLADIVAYCLNWGFRLKSMNKAGRKEIEPYADKIRKSGYVGKRPDENGDIRTIWGITYISDLRPKIERED